MSHATEDAMKILLVGPCPPPRGGISVHVETARRLLRQAGVPCLALDAKGHRAAGESRRSPTRDGLRLLIAVRRLARRGWTLHLHTNGHNPKSWLLALACGLAATAAPGRVLTLHSGMVPHYLSRGPWWCHMLARLALGRFDHVVCVNDEIRATLVALGGTGDTALDTLPAYLPAPRAPVAVPDATRRWLASHQPVIATTLFFRPEYGFELLLEAVSRLAPRHPRLGCLVMGGQEGEAEARRPLRDHGANGRLLLAGDLTHDLCLELLSRSDLFVRPTLVDGDALSVREALSLGLPVVASDTGARPPGVSLFRPGDLDGLVAGIEAALEPAAQPPAPPGADFEVAGSLDRLLETYRVVGRREAPCRAV